MPGSRPSSRVRRRLTGAALAFLAAVLCAPAESVAGCHRNDLGRAAGAGTMLENLQSLGALGGSRGMAEAPLAPASGRGACNGPFCSSNSDPVSSAPSFVPVQLKGEWGAIDPPPPAASPDAIAATTEGREPWTNPPLLDVFHPPRRPVSPG